MASLIKTAITDMLTTLTNTGQFNYVAIWNNHVERLISGDGYSYNCPAAFVELETSEIHPLNAGITHTDYIIRIHIVHNELDATDGTLDQNLNVFDYRDAVKVAFTNLRPTNFSNLMYYNEFQDYDHTNVYHYIVEFRAAFIDTKGSPYDADSEDWIDSPYPLTLVLDINSVQKIFTAYGVLTRKKVIEVGALTNTVQDNDLKYSDILVMFINGIQQPEKTANNLGYMFNKFTGTIDLTDIGGVSNSILTIIYR
jgi:hypothetical protein